MSKCEQCIIRQFNALKSLHKEDLVRITSCKTSKVIKKGAVIFEEGENINGVFCIREGICKLTKLSPNGKEQIVRLVIKGDLLGQRSLVSNEVANLTAVAANDMEVCFIPKQEIVHNLSRNINFSMDMLKSMADELKLSENIIVDMAQKTVKQRLAETLLYLRENFGEDINGFLNIVLTREDYANIVGTATESAIRLLSQFKKEGLIATEGKKIKIENSEALKLVE
ncbi:Crp/Fnr family transcriptional regulator [Tamlana nanhaiensis]|uniref:Crp/Fnr family transcriptional regulator n=1 Tax=Neotamlana nanhaiensis TaxID=1382798 RepID=A0A0D7W3N8_9FLAO|nr:Crp/Fnr family transcriptional regulator [Tamlana nanhaiensis]KJD33308.1 Crp/Fnr family transcriptional regulator [Tamlana nanhaiensis]